MCVCVCVTIIPLQGKEDISHHHSNQTSASSGLVSLVIKSLSLTLTCAVFLSHVTNRIKSIFIARFKTSAADVILTRVQLQISKRIGPHALKFFTFSVRKKWTGSRTTTRWFLYLSAGCEDEGKLLPFSKRFHGALLNNSSRMDRNKCFKPTKLFTGVSSQRPKTCSDAAQWCYFNSSDHDLYVTATLVHIKHRERLTVGTLPATYNQQTAADQ